MSTDYNFWFDWQGAHADIEVDFVNPIDGEEDGDIAEIVIAFNVSEWEYSAYRSPARDFEVTGISVEAFGRTYHFEAEDIVPDVEGFFYALVHAYDRQDLF